MSKRENIRRAIQAGRIARQRERRMAGAGGVQRAARPGDKWREAAARRILDSVEAHRA